MMNDRIANDANAFHLIGWLRAECQRLQEENEKLKQLKSQSSEWTKLVAWRDDLATFLADDLHIKVMQNPSGDEIEIKNTIATFDFTGEDWIPTRMMARAYISDHEKCDVRFTACSNIVLYNAVID